MLKGIVKNKANKEKKQQQNAGPAAVLN